MKKKILLVDDVKLFLHLEETFFRRTGCEILTAESGTQALCLAREHVPDLILLDYIMPDLMGDDVCRQLKSHERTSEIPIIIVSTSSEPGDIQKCFAAGADDYVTKPINPQEILSKAAALLKIPHRVHVRTPVRFQVRGEVGGRVFNGFTRNLSRGGVLIETPANLEPGTEIFLDLPLLPEGASLRLTALVVRKDWDDIERMYYLGIQFHQLSSEQKAALENFLVQH